MSISYAPQSLTMSGSLTSILLPAVGQRAPSKAQEQPKWGGVREALVVPTVTLDALVAQLRPPDVVKIDIEGAEGAAFANASSFLDKHPILIIEVSAANSEDISKLLESRGYRLFDILRVQEGAEIPCAAPNTIALPPCWELGGLA